MSQHEELNDHHMRNVVQEVMLERYKQHEKWGPQNHSPAEWLMILGEEVGEANKAALETHFSYKGATRNFAEYRKELVQVAAVAIAMIESLDRNEGVRNG